jgi:hypothetical protein
MDNVNVIFDTNIYRVLTYGLNHMDVIELIEKIKRAEKARNITGILSGVTAMELLSHLAANNDPGFNQCKMATIAAGIHATGAYFSFMPHVTLQLQQLIFGQVDPIDANGNETIANLVSLISSSEPEKIIDRYKEQIQEINRLVQLHKSDFIATAQATLLLIDPGAINSQVLKNDKERRQQILKMLNGPQAILIQARGYFDKTVRDKDYHFTKEEATQKIEEIARCFKTALVLHAKLLERMIVTGYDMSNNKKNRANTIFDIYQLFNVNDETVGGKKSVFVTNETWLKEVALESGFADKVIKLNEYLDKLDLSV